MDASKITSSPLFKQANLIDGKWFKAAETMDVFNPSTGEKIGTIPKVGFDKTCDAIDAAETAFQKWKLKTADERSIIIEKWYDLMIENREILAQIMTLEQGKVMSESLGEVDYGAAYVRWFAHEARRSFGDTIPTPSKDKRYMTIKQPVGVVGIITPWNFPNAMIARKIAPALAAGCTVVIKPAELTPYSAFAMAELASRAGVPDGVINMVTGDAVEIGRAITESKLVKKFTFTGSTPVGKFLYKACSETVKKITLELGGNAPFIVCDNADIDSAVAGAMLCKFRNTGQTCVCANRFIVHKDVHDEFVSKLVDEVKKLKVGDGFNARNDLGPLMNTDAVKKINKLLKSAVADGANIEFGETSQDESQCFYHPVVISGIKSDMDIFTDEIFGPVVSIAKADSNDHALSLANNSIYGLASYFYSENLRTITKISEGLEYGMVGVNEGRISSEVAPFGGIKQSGLGREGHTIGLEDYMELKTICMGNLN